MDLPIGSLTDLRDEPARPTVLSSETALEGLIFDVRRDRVDLGAGGVVTREYLAHTGAVVVVALREIEGVDHLVMIRQYRHPVRALEWELPAGLLDVAEEVPVVAAARELAEEVELAAERWDLLVDFSSTPGSSSEIQRVYLARDVTPLTGGTFERTGEEAGITGMWVPLDDAYDAVLAGRIHNPGAVVGALAAWGARAREWSTLRPPDTPWPLTG